MNCDWSAKLDLYVDSELSDSDLEEVQAHLLTCQACVVGALSRMQLKRTTQAAAQRFRPSPKFRLKVEQSVRVAKGFNSTARWSQALAAVAALLLLSVSAALWLQRTRADEQAFSELADLHVSTLASPNPVDVISTDRHTVKPWFQGKLPFTFNLPELQNTPFNLVGGRITYFHQSPGAQLLFGTRKHEISVFIFQNRGETSRFSVSRKLTFNSETWTENGLRYVVIGDASASDLRSLSELLKTA